MTVPQPQLLPAQQISLLDIYTKQIELSADMKSLKEKLPDHETRIRSLERWRYGLPLTGLVAAGSMALTVWGILHQ